MKKLATLFLAIMISGIAFGQDRQQRGQERTPEQRAKLYTERLTKQLTLSDEQQKKVYDLTLEQSNKTKDRAPRVRGEMNKEKIEKMRAEREAHQDKLKNILTPEQLKILNESRASVMRDRGQVRDRGDRKSRNGMKDSVNKIESEE